MAKVLIIDDDVQVRDLLKQMLEKAGYDVMTASNGKEGINLQKHNPADLIITDIIMPEKEGLETIMELRRDFGNSKIIAISGGGRLGPDDNLQIAKVLGAAITFSKPIDRKELLEAIDSLLNK